MKAIILKDIEKLLSGSTNDTRNAWALLSLDMFLFWLFEILLSKAHGTATSGRKIFVKLMLAAIATNKDAWIFLEKLFHFSY